MTEMKKLILDTHVLIWYIEGIRLSEDKVAVIDTARAKDNLYISTITIWEIAMLVAKEKIVFSVSLKEWVDSLNRIEGLNIMELSLPILIESCNLPHYPHKDPADRIIIASTREHNAHIITFDQKILDYAQNGYLKIA